MIDHRKLGRELDLYDNDPLIGSGLPIWLPAGAAARYEVESYLHELERRAGYQHVYSSPMAKRELYEISGHWKNFSDDMYPPMAMGEHDELVLRPSLCPQHALIFRSRGRSYRELPLRIAELGGQYRAERSGVVGGLQRVRAMQLNDSHNFCAPDQVGDEIAAVLQMISQAHHALGIRLAGLRLSLRDGKGKYAGEPDQWLQAEELLRKALQGYDFVEAAGEAAFYGPKIDVQVVDPAGRESTISTIQVDFHLPNQFDLEYSAPDGSRRRPVIVHRSLVGSMERLFAHLIEVHAGAFPAWYAPVQLHVLPVGADQHDAADELVRQAVAAGLRAEVLADGSLGARVRAGHAKRIPYQAVIGAREAGLHAVNLRVRDGRQLDLLPAGEMLRRIREVVESRSLQLLID
jgi:threonyl-tRNA synthetase